MKTLKETWDSMGMGLQGVVICSGVLSLCCGLAALYMHLTR